MIRFYVTPLSRSHPHVLYKSPLWYETDEFLEFDATVEVLCSGNDVNIISSQRVQGVWEDFVHPAMEYSVDGSRSDVIAVCGRLAELYDQDSVLMLEEGSSDSLCVFSTVFDVPVGLRAGMLKPHLEVVGDPEEFARLVGVRPDVVSCSAILVSAEKATALR